MKHKYPLVAILLMIVFAGCKKQGEKSDPTPAPAAGSYTLQVNGGQGSGKYAAGDTAYVFSDPPATTQVFDKWAGDTANLLNPHEWRSVLKMPSANTTLTANYKNVPAVTFTNTVINGSQVYYYVPVDYRGIIMPFHGTGGSAANWVLEQADNMNFCRYAVANGYAIVVTESENRTTAQWDLSATNNVDVANIDVILNSLKTSGIIAAGKPMYGIGMSDGSAFCSLIAYLRKYNASALYCYGGVDKVFPLTSTPTIWNMAMNDVVMDPNRQAEAQANYNVLSGRGIAAVYYVNQPTPVYASRFTIINNMSLTTSTAVYNSLQSGGFLSNKGFVKTDPMADSTWQNAIPALYKPAINGIEDQLYVAYGEHKFYKDSNYRTIQFFNRF